MATSNCRSMSTAHQRPLHSRRIAPTKVLLHLAVLIASIQVSAGFQTSPKQIATTTTNARPKAYQSQRLFVQSTSDDPATTQKTAEAAVDFAALRSLSNCQTAASAHAMLSKTLGGNAKALYGSVQIPVGASDRGISDGDLAIQTKVRNKKYGVFNVIDLNGDKDADRASAGVLGIFLASSLSAIAANQNLPGPEIVRFAVVWLLSFAPLALVGYGIATPDKLQTLLVSLQRNLFLAYRQRMIQHEAGHFLIAHLLGFPIQGYSANAVKNAVEFYPLNDPSAGSNRAKQLGFDGQAVQSDDGSGWVDAISSASADASYFSKDGRGSDLIETRSVFRKDKNYTDNPFLKLPTENDPSLAWPYRGFDHAAIDRLAAVSLAGVAAEIIAFGNAEGGVADFSQLRAFFSAAEPELTERETESRIRFSIGFTMTQLRLHLGALDDLAAVMERGGTIAECVEAIESCTNVNGYDGIFGDSELRRRTAFREKGFNILEKLLLGEKTVDTEENRFVEGRGGGYKEETGFGKISEMITGDDPLYIAAGIALLFVAWGTR